MTIAVLDELDEEFFEQEYLAGQFVDYAEDHAWLGSIGEEYIRHHLDG